MMSDTFLSARNVFASDIHRQICEVYGATAMCEGKVLKWVKDSKLAATFSGGKFWIPRHSAWTLRRVVFYFSNVSNIIST